MNDLISHSIHNKYRAHLLCLADRLHGQSMLRTEEDEVRKIAHNLKSPFNIAVFGRMKVGKSSLINAIIGQKLTITDTEEATATINRISYATGAKLNTFTIHWLHAQAEERPLSELKTAWSGKSEQSMENTRHAAWLELYADAEPLKDIYITDTPGTGSAAASHEEIARQFIKGQAADALLYVFSTDVHEQDDAALADFRKYCMTSSSLNNTLGVFHRWDSLFFEHDGDLNHIAQLANSLRDKMQKWLPDVVLVSAPIGLLAQTARPEFWEACRSVLNTFEDEEEFKQTIFADLIWNMDAERKALYRMAAALDCPWASFRAILLHLYRNPTADPAAATLELSGLPRLKQLLDTRFFSNKVVIQHGQNAARIRSTMTRAFGHLATRLAHLEQENTFLAEVCACTQPHAPNLYQQAHEKLQTIRAEKNALQQYQLSLSVLYTQIEEWSGFIIHAQELIPWLANGTHLPIDAPTRHMLLAVLYTFIPGGKQNICISQGDFRQLTAAVNSIRLLPEAKDKINGSHLHLCLMNWANAKLCASYPTMARTLISWLQNNADSKKSSTATLLQLLSALADNKPVSNYILSAESYQALQPDLYTLYRLADSSAPDISDKLRACLERFKPQEAATDIANL